MQTQTLRHLTRGATLILLLSLVVGPVEARELQYRERSAGTLSDSNLDTDGDGSTATQLELSGKSRFGRFLGQSRVEYGPNPLAPPNQCPQVDRDGNPELQLEFEFVAGFGVKTFDRGDQLIQLPTSSLLCVNPANGVGFFQNTGIFVGGTGRFAGASGSFETEGTISTLLLNADGTPGFGIVNFSLEGPIKLP